MEQQPVQVEEGINLAEVFRLLLSKLKALILILLVACVLGAGISVLKTHDVKYYGTEVEFYVNPEKEEGSTGTVDSQYGVYGAYGKHVMDNMIKLLGSEVFAEQMILERNDGVERVLPKDAAEWYDETETEKIAKLNAAIVEGNAKWAAFVEAQDAYDGAIAAKVEANEAKTEADKKLSEAWAECYKAEPTIFLYEEFNEVIYNAVKDEKVGNDYKYQKLIDAYTAKTEAQNAVTTANDNVKIFKANRDIAKQNSNEKVNAALSIWRESKKYQAELVKYKAATKFSYLSESDSAKDTDNLARSFIYVRINVLNDKGFAEEVWSKIKTVVPSFVSKYMTVPAGYDGTNCQPITITDSIRHTNPGYIKNQAIKFGLLAGLAAFVVACIVFVVIDQSNKRLRDTDIITRKFNVPLLGFIPAIEEISDDAKKSNKKTSTEVK